MADSHIAEIKGVITSLQAHNVLMQEMLTMPADKFALTEYIGSQALLALSKDLPDVVPNDDIAMAMEKPQLEKLMELVGEVVALQDAVRESDAALRVKVKAFARRYGVGGTRAQLPQRKL